MRNITLVLVITIGISACESIPKWDMTSRFCSPSMLQKISFNTATLRDVQVGMHADYIISIIGAAENINRFALFNNQFVEAYFYRVSHKGCRGGSSYPYEYEPVFISNGIVVGKGHGYYERQIKPFLIVPQAEKRLFGF